MVKPLVALALAACSLKAGIAFVAVGSHPRRVLSTRKVLASNDDGKNSKRPLPPSLVPNAKQEAVLKAMGFNFDHKRRRWVRGKVPSGADAVSSGGRRLEIVDLAGGNDLLDEPRPAVAAAAAHLQEVLRAARDDVVGPHQQSTAALQRLAARNGMYLWAGGQALALALAAHVVVSDGTGFGDNPLPALALGLTAGLSAAFYDRKQWALQPGLEPSAGALERALVDAALGCYALPAPWDWRADHLPWKVGALLLEGVSAATGCALVHGVVQVHVLVPWAQRMVDGGPPLDPLLTDPAWFGPPFETTHAATAALHSLSSSGSGLGLSSSAAVATLAVAALAFLAAVAEAAHCPNPEVAAAEAEVAAAARARTGAHAHFERTRRLIHRATSAGSSGDARAATAAEAADATVALAAAWERKFAVPAARAAWELPFLAALSTGVAAAAFELSGGDLLAPLSCAAAVLVDRCALRPTLRDHGRATATLAPAPAQASAEAAATVEAERAAARADSP